MKQLISVTQLVDGVPQEMPRTLGLAHIVSIQYLSDSTTIVMSNGETVIAESNLRESFSEFIENMTTWSSEY